MEFFTISSLEKVFPDERPHLFQTSYSMLKNERFNFQAVCYSEEHIRFCKLKIDSELKDYINVSLVKYVPVVMSNFGNVDDYVIDKNSGLFPDPIIDISDADINLIPKKWTAFWFTINDNNLKAGNCNIKISLFNDNDIMLCETVYNINILKNSLPTNDLITTNWMHYDCIAESHNVKVFSDEFFEITKNYISSAVNHGMTMLYTPLFTPPLDTQIGKERLTVQLVKVNKLNNIYSFDLSLLDKFIDLAFGCGIKYLEFSHLFTQWGAQSCPKIMANVDGEYKKIFGWENTSTSDDYINFLDSFLQGLVEFINNKGIRNKVFFHISDEPHESYLPTYKKCYKIIKKHLNNIKIIDALSSIEIYKQGACDIPIVLLGSESPFMNDNIDYWVYYCCAVSEYRTNRYITMPLQRVRILGIQLYLNNIKGFLHWGFNFYHSALSRNTINPYFVTDADGAFPAGDSFIVYPGKNKPIESIRHEAFCDGIQDYLALNALEQLKGREFVVNLIKNEGLKEFTTYPKNTLWHISFREKINNLLQNG